MSEICQVGPPVRRVIYVESTDGDLFTARTVSLDGPNFDLYEQVSQSVVQMR